MARRFITDMGESVEARTLVNIATGEQTVLGRYGVWESGDVIEVSDDLCALRTKYGEMTPVMTMKGEIVSYAPIA